MKLFVLTLFCAMPLVAKAADSPRLHDEIASVDGRFFDAFNACDLKTMGDMFSKDLEFYHDLGGVHGYKDTMETTRENCERGLGLRRRLVEGSLKVYPIKGYGAIQVGQHTFCHKENGKDDCGTFDFVHVWQRTDKGWVLARVVSYGH